MSKKQTKK
jgi:hypothetical protein